MDGAFNGDWNCEFIGGSIIENGSELVELSKKYAWGIFAPSSTFHYCRVILRILDGTSESYSKMIRIGEDATWIGLKLVAGDAGKVVLPKLLKKHKKHEKAKTRNFEN